MKTPEEMALEYADDWHKDCDYPAEILRHTKKATETVFLAGYQAGCTNTQSELAVGREVVEFLLEKPQWISVKERLPETGKVVLAAMPKGTVTLGGIRKKTQAWDVFLDMAICTAEPTHWMPLPEPPKEER